MPSWFRIFAFCSMAHECTTSLALVAVRRRDSWSRSALLHLPGMTDMPASGASLAQRKFTTYHQKGLCNDKQPIKVTGGSQLNRPAARSHLQLICIGWAVVAGFYKKSDRKASDHHEIYQSAHLGKPLDFITHASIRSNSRHFILCYVVPLSFTLVCVLGSYLGIFTFTGFTFQISLQYSLMVLSLENLPLLATFNIDILVHFFWSL
jgi:hypothetical protein